MSCWPGKVIQNQSSVPDSKKWGKLLDKPDFLYTFKRKDPEGEASYPSSGWGRKIMNLRFTWPVSWAHDQPGKPGESVSKSRQNANPNPALPIDFILLLNACPLLLCTFCPRISQEPLFLKAFSCQNAMQTFIHRPCIKTPWLFPSASGLYP